MDIFPTLMVYFQKNQLYFDYQNPLMMNVRGDVDIVVGITKLGEQVAENTKLE
jgi:hypothetical protein